MTTPEIITFGCRLNSFESEVMRAHASGAGLERVVIVNTCAVTSEAVRQAGQTIRKVRREQPDAQIVVTGCAAQIETERFRDMTEVDAVIGNAEKMRPESWRAIAGGTGGAGPGPRVQVSEIMALTQTAHHLIDAFGSRARAYVEIQNGCDHRCTFCIIPYGRGPSRSIPAQQVVAQVRRLVEVGYQEIVLTGVDITSYGLDLGGDEMRLGDLVATVLREVPELRRLRLSSIDSVETDAALVRALADEPRLMPHLHLSLQAGDDMVLKRMKRRHLRQHAVAFCDEVRRLRPDVAFGADLIAGFPTETEEMFANTERLVDECGLTYLHVFPFSPRPGTPAARMPQVERKTAKDRAARLRALGDGRLAAFLDNQIGREVEVLVERDGMARTPHFAEVEIDAARQPGALLQARVTGNDGRRLTGMVVGP